MADTGERAPQCPFCGDPVRDMKTAITTPDAQKPAHFDCVLQDISRREGLQPGEKAAYLGKGTFGIVSYRPGSGSIPFVIRKRIPYEQPAARAPREGGESPQ